MVLAAKQATSVIPIVFAATGDPVGTGLDHGFKLLVRQAFERIAVLDLVLAGNILR
jgi:hypothetical protein